MNQKYTLTHEGVKQYEEELQKLKIEREENIIALKEARAQGDLSENADYDTARDRQAQIASRIAELEKILKNYDLIKEDSQNNLGKYVTIRFLDDGSEVTYKIVGPLEADPMKGFISYESPLGHAVVNRGVSKPNERIVIKPDGGEQFEVQILAISNQL